MKILLSNAIIFSAYSKESILNALCHLFERGIELKMNRRGNIVSYRPDVKVLDATIRDGGLVNNFYFDDEFVRALYLANVKAGVDYMEFGYKASKDIFSPDKFGKWKFCDDEDIRAIVGDNNTDLKISVMADVGRTDFRRDIKPRSESVIDMVRVATYINTIPAALEIVEYCHELGYETTVNIMAISNAGIYLVDSYGSLYPEQIARLTEKYLAYTEKAGKFLGIHAHNNQQLAFANTIESMSLGASYLDATVSCMGRGAGNCAMELLLGFFKNPKFNISPILSFIEKYMLPLKASGIVWGYDVPYLLTYADFYQELLDRD